MELHEASGTGNGGSREGGGAGATANGNGHRADHMSPPQRPARSQSERQLSAQHSPTRLRPLPAMSPLARQSSRRAVSAPRPIAPPQIEDKEAGKGKEGKEREEEEEIPQTRPGSVLERRESGEHGNGGTAGKGTCLLYTSDAADDM
eukprot:338873-Rhodomonas_salina.2